MLIKTENLTVPGFGAAIAARLQWPCATAASCAGVPPPPPLICWPLAAWLHGRMCSPRRGRGWQAAPPTASDAPPFAGALFPLWGVWLRTKAAAEARRAAGARADATDVAEDPSVEEPPEDRVIDPRAGEEEPPRSQPEPRQLVATPQTSWRQWAAGGRLGRWLGAAEAARQYENLP